MAHEFWVKVDVAQLCFEIAMHKGKLEDWTVSFANSLAYRDASLNDFGARILAEMDTYKETKSAAGKKSAEARFNRSQQKSTEVNRSQQTSTITSNDVRLGNDCISVFTETGKEEKIQKKTIARGSEEIEIPEKLRAIEGFCEIWDEWIRYRIESKKPLTSLSKARQLKTLADVPEPLKTISQSIENGWQGLFEVKAGSGNAKSGKSGYKDQFDKMSEFGDWIRDQREKGRKI